MKSLAG